MSSATKKYSQSGVAHLLLPLLLAVIGLVAFFLLTSFAPFKDRVFSFLYSKPSSFAALEPINPSQYTESFELGFGGWVPDHWIDCEHNPNGSCRFDWNITRTQNKVFDGGFSLEGYLNGINDDGTIWVEREFSTTPNSTVDVSITFQFWSPEQSSINSWPVLAYIGLANPEKETDFPIIGRSNEVAEWKQYTYRKQVATDSSGKIWVGFGFGATWETPRTYFLDLVNVNIPSPEESPLLVHFKVVNEEFVVGITNPQAKQDAIDNYLGKNNKHIPVGPLVDDRPNKSRYDSRWSWHFDSTQIQMAENTIELCDGLPSYVEKNLDYWMRVGQFCPWGAEITAIEGINPPPNPTLTKPPTKTPTPTIPVDNVAPKVSLITPLNNSYVKGGSIPVKATVTDNVGVTWVSFFSDAILLTTDATFPYEAVWNTINLADGSKHTVRATGYDKAGNKTTVVNTVTVDKVSPTVKITNPTQGSLVPVNSTVTLTANATDDKKLFFVGFAVNAVVKCQDTVAPYRCNWIVPPTPGATYNIRVNSYDSALNAATQVITVKSK